MDSDQNRMDRFARAQELKRRGESARSKDGAMARLCYEEAVGLFREVDEPLVLAHTIRHLGDVYLEQGRPDLAEPCYHEALGLYRSNEDDSSLDLANAVRSLAVLRWEQARTLWEEVHHLYISLHIEAGIKESADRVAALRRRRTNRAIGPGGRRTESRPGTGRRPILWAISARPGAASPG